MLFISKNWYNQNMLHLDKVSKKYKDESIALDDVSIIIRPKEFVSVVGHSGAGKTTLLKMILAEESPSDGTVYFEKTDIHSLK